MLGKNSHFPSNIVSLLKQKHAKQVCFSFFYSLKLKANSICNEFEHEVRARLGAQTGNIPRTSSLLTDCRIMHAGTKVGPDQLGFLI